VDEHYLSPIGIPIPIDLPWVATIFGVSFPTLVVVDQHYLTSVHIPIPIGSLSSTDPPGESQMLNDVNAARNAVKLPSLNRDSHVASIARAYAHDMVARRYFGHHNPEGKNVGDRFESAGVNYQYAGENIAFVQSEKEAMQGFLKSSDHRFNILNSHYTRIGIGIIVIHGYGTMYVQEFSGGPPIRGNV
jgi:uncharacterized protein YkwD